MCVRACVSVRKHRNFPKSTPLSPLFRPVFSLSNYFVSGQNKAGEGGSNLRVTIEAAASVQSPSACPGEASERYQVVPTRGKLIYFSESQL